ncbi:aspartyl-phosphate phosphatase Spo0E family protein [Bacillus songklensis]|uniref:Aspartyl-phosphate phosphatase Spo0E family protein n=1 Tax=Bacillus songklensis TaxID=1069116 RepID=A0ABV8B2R1_9BACI
MSTTFFAADQIEDLPDYIVNKRKELMDLGINYGFLDEKTIKCSQDLDKLINLYMRGPNACSLHSYALCKTKKTPR